MKNTPLRLGIAGLGTVGVGTVKIVQQHAELMTRRAGRPIMIAAVSARSKDRDRGVSIADYAWEDDPVALAKRDDVDVFVELIGGEDGPAKAAVEAALSLGKDVVTANKALLAIHGQTLAETAEEKGAVIRFEAAVAGGIPIIKSLTEGLAGNEITRVAGVMNGTCNYILTRMEAAGLNFEEAFAEADGLGFVEADPTLDIGGIDAGHKLALLATIAFGAKVDFAAVDLQGIDTVTIDDIRHAADMGYKIKLLGVAQLTGRGLEQRMTPCLVPETSPFAQLSGGTNMVAVEGDSIGQVVLRGAGAGEGPTASAVMGDVVDLARGIRINTFGQPATGLRTIRAARAAVPAPYYLRLLLQDKPGALAKVATVLGEYGVSIDRMRQREHESEAAPVLIVTHKTAPASIVEAMEALPKTGVVEATPVYFRVETI